MKKLGSLLVVVLAFVAVFFFARHIASECVAGFGLAVGVPLMPRGFFGRLVNRDLNINSGTWGPAGEELRYPIYDRYKLSNAGALNPITLFNTPVGSPRNNVALTYADTNIESVAVPSSQKFKLEKLTVYYMSAAQRTDALIASALSYFQSTSFRLNVESKEDMFRLPAWKFFGSVQLISAPAVTVNSRFPQSLFTAVWDFSDIPLTLQALVNWKVVVEPQVASVGGLDGDYFGFEFDGTRLRLN